MRDGKNVIRAYSKNREVQIIWRDNPEMELVD